MYIDFQTIPPLLGAAAMSEVVPTALILGHSFVKRLKRDLHQGFDSRASCDFNLLGTASVRLHGVGVRKGKEALRDVRKFRKNRKSNKNFSYYVKRLNNKYGKNCKNNKFNEILQLEREKVKKGFEMSANFAKIAKVTRIFLTM